MPVKPFEIAFVKTTEEPVFVLEIKRTNGELPLDAGMETATVRRPVATKEGIQHRVDTFLVCELEDNQEHAKRQLAQAGMLRDSLFGEPEPEKILPEN